MLNYFLQNDDIDLFNDEIVKHRFEEAAEKAKIELTSKDQVDVHIPFISVNGFITDLKF